MFKLWRASSLLTSILLIAAPAVAWTNLIPDMVAPAGAWHKCNEATYGHASSATDQTAWIGYMRQCLAKNGGQRISAIVGSSCQNCTKEFIQKVAAKTTACADGANEFIETVNARFDYSMAVADAARICRFVNGDGGSEVESKQKQINSPAQAAMGSI